MKLSARARYAARLLLELAATDDGQPIRSAALSERTAISVQFIEQIIRPLKKAGIIDSVRGAAGGYLLKRPAAGISLGEIVRIMEGGIKLAECCATPENCERASKCKTRDAWARASKALEEELDAVSLTDLLDDPDSLQD